MLVEWVSFHLLLMAFLVFCEPTVQCPSCLTMVLRFHLSVSACYTPDDISSTSLGYLYTILLFRFSTQTYWTVDFPTLVDLCRWFYTQYVLPPCSTILGFTLPLLCSITSIYLTSAINWRQSQLIIETRHDRKQPVRPTPQSHASLIHSIWWFKTSHLPLSWYI